MIDRAGPVPAPLSWHKEELWHEIFVLFVFCLE
jgi:hypothetical protein